MKKILILTFLMISIFITNFEVKAVTNESFYNAEYLSNVYIKKIKGYSSRYETGRFIRRTSDGYFAYCLQPFVEFIDGKVNTAYDSDYEIITNLTKEKWERVSLLAYYGYGYSNHTDNKWYIITQMMIWKTVDSSDIFFTDTLNGNRISKYEREMQELELLVNNHGIKPSFDNLNINILLGETLKLNDNNNVINNYKISSSNNISVEIKENILFVKGENVGKANIILENKDIKYNRSPIVYVDNINQDLLVVGSYKPITTEINFNILAGKIKIKKLDLETSSSIPLGEGSLENAYYEIINNKGEILETVKTDFNGNAFTNYLPIGDYIVREVKAPNGYNLDKTEYQINIKESKTYEIKSYGEIIKGNIEITKLDKETGICKVGGEATLKGSEYAIYDYKNNLVDKIVINADCKGISKKLPYGIYIVKEMKASTGYNLDKIEYQISIKENKTYEIKSYGEIIKGNIEITKLDKETGICKIWEEATLKGAEYAIYDYKNNLVDKIVINADCKGISKKLPYGIYIVKEIKTSTGYNLDKIEYQISIKENKTYGIKSYGEIIKGRIKINIVDSKNNICKPRGEATLVGAKYAIYNNKNELVDTLTIDNNCMVISKYLPYGNYKIKEILNSKGYYLNQELSYQLIEDNKDYLLNLKEEVITNEIKIYKFYGNNDTGMIYSEPNSTFQIIDKNNKIVETILTDKNGYVSIILPYGKYIIKQISGLENYKLISPFNIEVLENTNKIQINYLKNGSISAKLKLVNIDSESKRPILEKGGIFKIKNKLTNEYICQVTDKLICEFETNENGYFITPLPIFGGDYIVEQIKAPDSYLILNNKIEFSIKENTNVKEDILYGTLIELEYENKPMKGNLEIYVKGEEINYSNNFKYFEYKDLKESIFNIYASEDIITKDGIKKYSKDELVDTIITNEKGYGKSKELYLGKYYFKGIKIDDKYILNSDKKHFELNKLNINQKEEIINYLKKGTLKINIMDYDNKLGIENVLLALYDKNNNLITKTKTDEKGIVNIDDLCYGKYYIKEIEIKENYILNSEIIEIEINKNITEIDITNKRKKGVLEIEKYSNSINGEKLNNVVFGIYADEKIIYLDGKIYEKDSLIEEITTNELGKAISKILPYGKYYIKELVTLEDHILNEEKILFEIKNEEKIELKIINEKKELTIIEVPDTLNNKNIILDNIELIIFVIWMCIYGKKRH